MKTRTSGTVALLLLLALLTLVISPWRNAVNQDDGAYAYSAIALSQGHDRIHAGTIAMNLGQFTLGRAALEVFPQLPPLALLNFITWLLFSLTVILFHRLTQIHWMVVAAFFLFPVWVQYGAIYHGEIYSAFFLLMLLALVEYSSEKVSKWYFLLSASVLSFLLGSQLQNMAAFPFFWGCFLLLRSFKSRKGSDTRLAFALMFGALASVFAFLIMNKTPFQRSYSYWLTQSWIALGPTAIAVFFGMAIQMFAAWGLYLMPALQWRHRSLLEWIVGLGLQAAVYLIIFFAPISKMSGAVLFLEYIPQWLGVFGLSLGIWGWWGVWPHRKSIFQNDKGLPGWGTAIAATVMLLFSTYRFALDIRYMMTWAIPFLFLIRAPLAHRKPFLGGQPFYLVLLFCLTSVVNVYMLNTNDARWRTADEYESSGIPRNQIFGGYGWNTFKMASDCMYKVVEKLERDLPPPAHQNPEFFRRFINKYGRAYEDEWTPKVLIKPSQVFGFNINLKKYRLEGQDSEPVKRVSYSVLGLPCQIAVFENPSYQPAWCDK